MPLRNRNGTWHYQFFANGRSIIRTTGLAATTRNERLALEMELEARREARGGKAPLRKVDVVSFRQAGEQFLDWADGEHREHPATANRLRISFASLFTFFEHTPVCSIQPAQVDDYKVWRRKCPQCQAKELAVQTCTACGGSGEGVREITLRHDLHALSAMFDYAIRHNWARRNPVKEVEIPSDANAVRIHVVTRAEEIAYFVYAAKRPNLHDVAKLILLQGMRPEEVLRLRLEDVDLERGTLRIARGKTKAARRALKLRAETIEILARRIAAGAKWLFPGKNPDLPISKLNNPHGRTLREAGVSFVLYDLRHTFATRAAEAGVPLATLAAILGHNNLRSVIKYVHPSEADQFRAIDRLDAVPAPVHPAESRWAN